jgi:hypothetical protein
LAKAATACGSCPPYVAAAVVLLKAENASLLGSVLTGTVPLLVAARQSRHAAELVAAYRQATAADRVAFAKAIGPTVLFDNDLVPAM